MRFGVAALLACAASPAAGQSLLHQWDFETDSAIVDVALDGARNGKTLGGASVSGGVLHLNGTTAYVQLDAHFIPASPAYTVALWVRADPGANSGGRREFISQGSPGAAFFLALGADGGSLAAGDNWTDIPGARFYSDGGWHHYALTMSAEEAVVYVDGARVASGAPYAGGGGGTPTRLGRGPGDAGRCFGGELDDVRVYSEALDDEQIRELMRGPLRMKM